MNEIWKKVKGSDGKYAISNLGKLKSLSLKSTKYPYGHISKNIICHGYYQVGMETLLGRKYFKIHRLIAIHFIPNPKNKKQINHIDGNKLNNEIKNLEWVTPKENIRHAIDNKLRKSWSGNKNPKSKLNNKKVLLIRNSKEPALYFANKFGISRSNIYDIRNGHIWKE